MAESAVETNVREGTDVGGNSRDALPEVARSHSSSPGLLLAAERLEIVGEPSRLQILILLGHEERTVAEIQAALGGQSLVTIGHHLALLRHGGLLELGRSGGRNFYQLTEAARGMLRHIGSLMGDDERVRTA